MSFVNGSIHELTIQTELGGLFKVDLDDGQYQYIPPVNMPATMTENIGFSLTDYDTDTSTGMVNLTLNRDPGTDGITLLVEGTGSGETINGTSSPEAILAYGGNDTVNAGDGNDVVLGGTGNDNLYGQGGDDILDGQGGDDNLYGGAGNDVLITDLNNNFGGFTGDLGADTLDGGADMDTLRLIGGNDLNFGNLNSGNNPITNIEVIDLSTDTGSNTLNNISIADVLDVTNATTGNLFILGANNDTVDFLNGDGWTKGGTSSQVVNGASHIFDMYTNSTAGQTMIVMVEQVINDTI